MGCFNENCALSDLPITYDTPVKLLFLTQNPYLFSDEKNQSRPLQVMDQWFVRTPPINGTYDDYGGIEFKKTELVTLIERVFENDIVEQPYGFNQYHSPLSKKKNTIQELIGSAREGRLLVYDIGHDATPVQNEEARTPKSFPTWKRVQEFLRSKKVKIMDRTESKGFNVQPVRDGVVLVHFNDYNRELCRKKLDKIKTILDEEYSTVFKDDEVQKDKTVLFVLPKGANHDRSILLEMERAKVDEVLGGPFSEYEFKTKGGKERTLPVLTVMIREDVWDVHVKLYESKQESKSKYTKEYYLKKIMSDFFPPEDPNKTDKMRDLVALRMGRMDGITLPFQTDFFSHLVENVKLKILKSKPQIEKVANDVAELTCIQNTLSIMQRSWRIPSFGSQSTPWNWYGEMFSELGKICSEKQKEEDDEDE